MAAPILIVEDDRMQTMLLETFLRKAGHRSAAVENGKLALEYLASPRGRQVQVVIMDMVMPELDGPATMQEIAHTYPDLPVIFLSGQQDLSAAIAVMKLGAFDYIAKPYDGERLTITLHNALKFRTLNNQVRRMKWLMPESALQFDDLIGHDRGLAAIVEIGRKVAPTDIPVLIMGETGVGKEVFARAVHGESARSAKPFVAINCGAIPETLIESILFGHEKGAFTGATEKTPGKFREADGGTIFLDEIGEMPMAAQVRLLRVLQQKEIEPVGAGRAVPVDVRVLSASNRDLAREVAAGRFREDLYFRLNVVPVTLPPLRQRRDDILLLAGHFMARFGDQGKGTLPSLTKETEQKLQNYRWPGNVRELENAVRRALVLSTGGHLKPEDFELAGVSEESRVGFEMTAGRSQMFISLLDDQALPRTLEAIEQDVLTRMLHHFGARVEKTAQALGIAKTTLYRKINKVQETST